MNKFALKKEIKEIERNIKNESKRAKCYEEKEKIKESAHKEFDIIYEKYGKEIYKKYVPSKYRKRDINQLLDEQRFLVLLNKHGESIFYDFIDTIELADIEYESKSNLNAILFKLKVGVFKKIIPGAVVFFLGVLAGLIPYSEAEKKQEKEKYLSQIEAYLDNIQSFGKNVKTQNLTDLQNYMYIMDDMWSNIKGYKDPQIDLFSYPGLDLATSEGYGVCRNMADDIALKLNAIDERYNARTITVNNVYGDYEMADIDAKFVEENELEKNENQNNTNEQYEEDNYEKNSTNISTETSVEKETESVMNNKEKKSTEVSSEVSIKENQTTEHDESSAQVNEDLFHNIKDTIMENVFGNHAVVLCDSIEDDVQIVLDPTNPGIGIFKNGRIVMFNSKGKNPSHMEYTPCGSLVYGLEKTAQIPENLIKSVKVMSASEWEYIMDKYSIKQQNKALAEVKKIKPKSFYDSVRIDFKVYEYQKNDNENVRKIDVERNNEYVENR